MAWDNMINFFLNAMQAGNLLNNNVNANKVDQALDETEINLTTKGNTFDLMLKKVPKELFAGTNRPGTLGDMYNFQSTDISKLNPYEKAKVEAEIALSPPEKPSSSILGLLKSVPLGGYRFNPKLGWGNVVNALSSMAIGKEMLKKDYEEKKRQYELDKQKIIRQALDDEISLKKLDLEEQKIKVKQIANEEKNKLLNRPIDIKQLYSGIYHEDFLERLEQMAKGLYPGEEINGKYHLSRLEYEDFLRSLKDMGIGGIDNAYRMFLNEKINNTKGEEKKRWQETLDNFLKSKASATALVEGEERRKMEEQRYLNRQNLLQMKADLENQAMAIKEAQNKGNYKEALRMFQIYEKKVGAYKNQLLQLKMKGAEDEVIEAIQKDLGDAEENMQRWKEVIEKGALGKKAPLTSEEKTLRGAIFGIIGSFYRNSKMLKDRFEKGDPRIKNQEELNKKIQEVKNEANKKMIEIMKKYDIDKEDPKFISWLKEAGEYYVRKF